VTTLAQKTDLFTMLLRLGDDNLVLAQRLGQWISWGPDLEEDIALGNLALDHLGVARACFQYAADTEATDRTEDDLAFLRSERQFTNLVLCEQPNGDFATTMIRQLFTDAYHGIVWDRLSASSDERLSGIAAKAVKETAYHLRHSSGWVVRLGDGTDESHRRTRAAVASLWKYVGELFVADPLTESFLGSTLEMEATWRRTVGAVLRDAGLTLPEPEPTRLDGRGGIHSEHLGHLLAEMQWMQRTYPGMTW